MTQIAFDFAPFPNQEDAEIQKWVDNHNRQVAAEAKAPSALPGSLLNVLNKGEAKTNAVYILRGLLNQQLRKSGSSSSSSPKKSFLYALKAEIMVKKTNQDVAQIVRNASIKMQVP